MARTRLEIKTLVRSHTGRTKDSLENSLCDSALKLALQRHPFNDAIIHPADFTLTEDEWKVDISVLTTDQNSVDISDYTPLNIVTARIVEASGSRNMPLKIKNRTWWDSHIVNPEDNTKGWPVYAMKEGNYVYFDRPLQSGLELRIRATAEQTFASDSTVCPIACLDLFVEKYVTSEIFSDIGDHEKALFWKIQALGPAYDAGKIGGELRNAIESDLYQIAEEVEIEERPFAEHKTGISVLNSNDWHERFGKIDVWY